MGLPLERWWLTPAPTPLSQCIDVANWEEEGKALSYLQRRRGQRLNKNGKYASVKCLYHFSLSQFCCGTMSLQWREVTHQTLMSIWHIDNTDNSSWYRTKSQRYTAYMQSVNRYIKKIRVYQQKTIEGKHKQIWAKTHLVYLRCGRHGGRLANVKYRKAWIGRTK